MSSAFSLLFDLPREAEHDRNRHYGIFPGIVTNNVDPEGMYRVKVRFPHLPGDVESFWARVVTPMAGKDRGWFFLPEVNDEVLVMFEHGDVHHPIVVGQIWNGRDIPPHDNADGKNDLRFFRSRNGHRVILDDTDGAEKIVIAEKTGKNRIVIDAVANTIQVLSEDGDITLNAPKGALKVDATSLLVHATDSLKITSGGEMTTKIGSTTIVAAGPTLDLKSGRTEFNPSSGSGGGGAAAATLQGDDTISQLNLAQQNEGEAATYGERPAGEEGASPDVGTPPEPPPVLVRASYSKPKIAPGEGVTMTVDTAEFSEGETVTMDVFERDGTTPLETISAQVQGGKATFEWKWDAEKHRGSSEVPVSQYEFKASGKGKESESALVEVVDWVEVEVKTPFGDPVRSQRWVIRTEDGKEHTGTTDGEGLAKVPATLHGEVAMEFPESHLLFKLELE